MTWHTSQGDRVLVSSERNLVSALLGFTVNQLRQRSANNSRNSGSVDDFTFGVPVFDELTTTEQMVLMKQVAEYLLTETSDTLELTARNEAAVYSIYQALFQLICDEILEESAVTKEQAELRSLFVWRTLALQCYVDCFADELDDFDSDLDGDPESPWNNPTSPTSRNVDQWEGVVEALADQILWDRDFEMGVSMIDFQPEKGSLFKSNMGIENDYFVNVSPDISDSLIDEAVRTVNDLTRRKPR